MTQILKFFQKQKQDLKNIDDKDELRNLIAKDVAEWLSQGNEIKIIPMGTTIIGDDPPTFSGDSIFVKEFD